jgi:hypothetical protein
MFGSGKDDDERFWNFMLFKIPMTDKEMEEGNIPWILAGVGAVGLLALIIWAIIKTL